MKLATNGGRANNAGDSQATSAVDALLSRWPFAMRLQYDYPIMRMKEHRNCIQMPLSKCFFSAITA